MMVETQIDEEKGLVTEPFKGTTAPSSSQRFGSLSKVILLKQQAAPSYIDPTDQETEDDDDDFDAVKISALKKSHRKTTSAPRLFLPQPVTPPERLCSKPVSAPRLFVQQNNHNDNVPQVPTGTTVPEETSPSKKKGWLQRVFPARTDAPVTPTQAQRRSFPTVHANPPVYDVDTGNGNFVTRQTLGVPMAQAGFGPRRTGSSHRPTKRSQREEGSKDTTASLKSPRVFAPPPAFDVDLGGKGHYITRKTLGVPMI